MTEIMADIDHQQGIYNFMLKFETYIFIHK